MKLLVSLWRRLSDSVASANRWRDRLMAAVWLTKARRWSQRRRLTRANEAYGEDSMVSRIATERLRKLDLGVQFWRPSPPLVGRTLEASRKAGVRLMDLRLLALNRDIRQVGDGIEVRRAWWAPVLAWCAKAYVAYHLVLLYTLAALAPAPWTSRVVAIGVISLLFWFFWPGFALYSTRAHAAVIRSGAKVERIAKKSMPTRAVVTRLAR